MPLTVVQSPGCLDVIEDELGDLLEDGDIVIDAGKIAESLGYVPTDPDANKALLRVASRMRGVAIVAANEANISGVVRTSNPRSVPRLLEQTGAEAATVIPLSRAEACRRIRKIYPNDRDRQLLCEAGLDRYYDNAE